MHKAFVSKIGIFLHCRTSTRSGTSTHACVEFLERRAWTVAQAVWLRRYKMTPLVKNTLKTDFSVRLHNQFTSNFAPTFWYFRLMPPHGDFSCDRIHTKNQALDESDQNVKPWDQDLYLMSFLIFRNSNIPITNLREGYMVELAKVW